MQPWVAVAYVAVQWGIRLVMMPVALRRRRPSSAMAWLLLIFLLPWAGLALYLLIGRQRLGRRRTRLAGRAHDIVQRATEAGGGNRLNAGHPDVSRRQHDLIAVAERVGEAPVVGGNALEGVANTEEAIAHIIEDIDGAKRHVHVLMYIFGDDDTGRAVGSALLRAVKRGVRCRVLADAVGSRPMLGGLAGKLREGGVEVVAIMPVNLARLFLSRIDIRNHRKLVVVDAKIAWTGSQNIVDAEYGRANIGAWQDVMLRVRGPAVLELQRVFLEDWYAETGVLLEPNAEDRVMPEPEVVGDSPVQVVSSGPHMQSRDLQDLYLAGIQEAERSLIISSPYFVPDEPLMAALRVAVMRGVAVDIIVPERSDSRVVGWAARAYLRELVEVGATVYLHHVGLLHAKAMTVDDAFAIVGSSNFDRRSFEINFELNLLLFGPQVAASVRALQQRHISESAPFTREDAAGVAWWRRYVEDIARLFSPLL